MFPLTELFSCDLKTSSLPVFILGYFLTIGVRVVRCELKARDMSQGFLTSVFPMYVYFHIQYLYAIFIRYPEILLAMES